MIAPKRVGILLNVQAEACVVHVRAPSMLLLPSRHHASRYRPLWLQRAPASVSLPAITVRPKVPMQHIGNGKPVPPVTLAPVNAAFGDIHQYRATE
jgi:hypothetical protein